MNWATWAALGLAALGLELVALLNKKPGDTLSEVIWWLLKKGAATALVPLYVWLGWHLFVEFWWFEGLKGQSWDDVALIVVAAGLTALVQWKQRGEG